MRTFVVLMTPSNELVSEGASVGQPTEPLLGTLSVYCEHDERVLDAIWRGER